MSVCVPLNHTQVAKIIKTVMIASTEDSAVLTGRRIWSVLLFILQPHEYLPIDDKD